MLKRTFGLLSLLFLGLGQCMLIAQAQSLSTDPDQFIQEFSSRLSKAGNGEKGRNASSTISDLWRSFKMEDDEKNTFIEQVNNMMARKFLFDRHIAEYTLAYASIKDASAYVQISPEQFFEVSAKAIKSLGEKRIRNYFNNLRAYVPAGELNKHAFFTWSAYQNDPRLVFIELVDDKKGTKYNAVVLRFTNTELSYRSARDSTQIFNTSGDFNLISKSFVGVGGMITWEKMGLAPDDVYVRLESYKTNFNYGKIKSDSAVFYYKSLIERPLKGYFEDLNLGYKNINKANFPYFRSYEGGVVIENIVEGVRYEGGFSLRGVRKLGSSYNKLVDYVPEPINESDFYEYGDDPYELDNSMDDVYGGYDLDEFGVEEGQGDDYYDDYYDDDSYTDDSYYDDVENDDYSEGDDYDDENNFSEMPLQEDIPFQVEKHVPAKLEIARGDRYVMKLQGEEFILDQVSMVSKGVQATIYISEEDSLYHPAMDLLFRVNDREVVLKKPKRTQLGRLPYTSSYHNFFLYFETIRWNLNSELIEFTAFIDQENKFSCY